MPNLVFLFNFTYLFLFCVYVFVHMCMGVLASVFVEVNIMPSFYVGTKD